MLRMKHLFCSFIVLLCLVYTLESNGRRYRMLGKKKYRPPSPYFIRRSGLSSSKLKFLFPTAAALGTIYIASRMRPHVSLRSYQDLYSHTVCEGERDEYDSMSGINHKYSYFLCPDDWDQRFESYCCHDERTSDAFCCSYDEKTRHYYSNRWGLVGGSIAALAILSLIAAFVYCICCRHRRGQPIPPPLPQPTMVTVGGQNVYSPTKPGFPVNPPPDCPYPSVPPGVGFPTQPAPPPTSIEPGSGWTVPGMNPPGSGWPEVPPPPYSACQGAPSAPPPN